MTRTGARQQCAKPVLALNWPYPHNEVSRPLPGDESSNTQAMQVITGPGGVARLSVLWQTQTFSIQRTSISRKVFGESCQTIHHISLMHGAGNDLHLVYQKPYSLWTQYSCVATCTAALH